MAVIGGADDFYRLRVIRVDEGDVPDLEWREDILYRRAPAQASDEYDVWQVQAVDDDENVTVVASFSSAEEAHGWMEDTEDDLHDMTRSQFERAYFPGDEAGPDEE